MGTESEWKSEAKKLQAKHLAQLHPPLQANTAYTFDASNGVGSSASASFGFRFSFI